MNFLRRRVMVSKVAAEGYVDLGLPSGLLWATCNLGATTEEEAGLYFAWGGGSDGHTASEQHVFGTNTTNAAYKSTISGQAVQATAAGASFSPDSVYDSARALLGSPWRVPTKDEFAELISGCNITQTTINGVSGYLFTSKVNGNSLFFIKAGYSNAAGQISGVGTNLGVWSSTLYAKGNSNDADNQGYGLNGDLAFDNSKGHWLTRNAVPIRPVRYPAMEYIDLGLPSGLLWATCNLGSSTPEAAGMYFSWGNVVGHAASEGYNFNSTTYNSTTGKNLTTDIPANANYDAAMYMLDGAWRMPDGDDIAELCSGTDQVYDQIKGVNGWKFINKLDSTKYIFIPLAGGYNSTNYANYNQIGYYWTSMYFNSDYRRTLRLETSSINSGNNSHPYYGYSIRPVCDIYYPGRKGAFVYTTNGKFYTATEWTAALNAGTVSNSNVVGVALISGEHNFVISLENNQKAFASSRTALTNGVVCTESEAKARFEGQSDTQLFVTQFGSSTNYGPGYAVNYTFANGKHGYIPSLGELWIAYSYKTQVNNCLSACGGTAFYVGYNMSSTYYGPRGSYFDAWVLDWNSGGCTGGHYDISSYFRVVCSLD